MSELKAILRESTSEIKKLTEVSIRQEEQLRYHIKRTDLLEESIGLLRDEVKPITKHVALVNAICKIAVGAGGTIAGIAGALRAMGVHL